MNKKILIIINNLGIGGAERLVTDDIKEMLRIGVDVTLVTLRPEPAKSFARELELTPDRFRCISFKGFLDISAWFRLVRYIRRFRPDLIITQLWFANTIGRIAAVLAGVNNVISFEQNVYDSVKTKKMFFVDWCLQGFSSRIIAVSKAVKRSLVSHRIQESRIDVLYNSIDLSAFSAGTGQKNLRVEYNIPPSAFLYVFIGRLIHQKAVDVLIEAFRDVDPSAYLFVIGQGRDRESLELQAQAAGLGSRVIFAGVRNDIPNVLFSADCFVLPSRYEGLPLVLTEALAAGRPIIVSNFEAASEMIVDGKNGLVVPCDNPAALASAMKRIKDEDDLRAQLSDEARQSAERFSISNHVRAILGYLKSTQP